MMHLSFSVFDHSMFSDGRRRTNGWECKFGLCYRKWSERRNALSINILDCKADLVKIIKHFMGLAEELGISILSFDRPGYGESDPHPARTEKSITSDIEELADSLQLGPKFYLIGFSMAARSCGAASSTSLTGFQGCPSLALSATAGGQGTPRTCPGTPGTSRSRGTSGPSAWRTTPPG